MHYADWTSLTVLLCASWTYNQLVETKVKSENTKNHHTKNQIDLGLAGFSGEHIRTDL